MKNILLILIGLGIVVAGGFYIDHRMQTGSGLESLKQGEKPDADSPAGAQSSELSNYGKASEFAEISKWLNSDPLTLASLKGKVVLIDFWTYSCINCIRTLPYVTKWYDTYKDKGFVVIGVHTPEFDFEKDTGNVQDAIKRFNIHYPVAQDNSYGTWKAYNNQYWPAEYLIDQKGNVVYTHFGEGNYDHTENAIRTLLGMTAGIAPNNGADLSGIQSPEMYFGTNRLQNLASGQKSSQATFTLPANLSLNTFGLGGNWKFSSENLQLTGDTGIIKLKFHASKVHMVAASAEPALLTITVDGKAQSPVTVKNSELYPLFSGAVADHVIEIKVTTPGFQAFTFTFS